MSGRRDRRYRPEGTKPSSRPPRDARPARTRPGRPPRRRGGGRTLLIVLLIAAAVVGVAWAVAGRGGDETAQTTTTVTEPPPVPVTFPEGLRREEMAAILAAKTHITKDAYLERTAVGRRGQLLAKTSTPRSLEGFLFPATYQVGRRLTAGELVDAQVKAYKDYTDGIDYRYARSKNLTKYDVLIIASMVEREVRVPAERPVVAGIMYERLHRGMRLDIDATVQYALGEWKPELTASDLAIGSPYNTRRFTGLPPGPICNPGLASLQAAAHPRRTGFLYYVARDDGSGRHYFARTPAEFEAAVARAAANRGG